MSRGPLANEPHRPPDESRRRRFLLVLLAILLLLWLAISALMVGYGADFFRFFWMLVMLIPAVIQGSVPIILLFACALGAGAIVARRWTSQQDSLLWMLAIAADHGMPLATTVRAFAEQFGYRYRRGALQLAERLERGKSLADALEASRELTSPDARLLVRAGQESGRVGQTLRATVSARSELASLRTGVAAKLSYLLGLLLIVQLIGGFCLYFIMPKYEAIFMDFGVGLPDVTIWVIHVGHFFAKYFFWVPPLTVILLIWIPFAVASWSGLNAPILSRFFKRRHATLILRSLGPFVEAGLPIERGMDMLADHYPTRWVRRKLTKAALRVHQGTDWRAALAAEGLIREADREALSAAAVVGNLPWAMNDLADAADRRGRVRIEAWAQTLYPAGVVLMGVVVLFLGMGFFAPLVRLMGRLSG